MWLIVGIEREGEQMIHRNKIDQEYDIWLRTARDQKTKTFWATVITNELSDWDDEKFIRLLELTKAAFEAGFNAGRKWNESR